MGLELDDPEFLTKYHNELGNQLRLLHYPPVPAAKLETQEVGRISAHSDWPSVTLLFQDDCGGLEIEDPHSPGKFVPATPMKGALVMNIGDMLMRWSNGKSCSCKPLDTRLIRWHQTHSNRLSTESRCHHSQTGTRAKIA